MRKALLAGFVLLSLVVAAGVPAPAAAAPNDGLAPEGVTIHIDIQGDGDARWRISTSYALNDSSDRNAFQDVAADYERGQGATGFSIDSFEAVAPEAADRTGRDMAIVDPEWTSEIQTEDDVERGYLRLSFTWTNFSSVGEETVSLGGVFDGGWFGDLGPDQTLVISPPSGYDVSSAQPSHETVDGRLRWTGPIEFGPNEPLATFKVQQTSPTDPGPPTGANIPWATIAGALITALVIGGIIAYTWFWRSERVEGPPPGAAEEPEEEPTEATDSAAAAAAATAAGVNADDDDHEPDGEEETATEPVPGAVDEPESEPEPEPELLSDEERVERLLEAPGGRMKQARIVEETRWSNAKVSQLLSQMADADRVEKLRIGRENLISLPDDEDEDGENDDVHS